MLSALLHEQRKPRCVSGDLWLTLKTASLPHEHGDLPAHGGARGRAYTGRRASEGGADSDSAGPRGVQIARKRVECEGLAVSEGRRVASLGAKCISQLPAHGCSRPGGTVFHQLRWKGLKLLLGCGLWCHHTPSAVVASACGLSYCPAVRRGLGTSGWGEGSKRGGRLFPTSAPFPAGSASQASTLPERQLHWPGGTLPSVLPLLWFGVDTRLGLGGQGCVRTLRYA